MVRVSTNFDRSTVCIEQKSIIECFYKLKEFFNQNNPDGLNDLLNLEDELYKAIDNSKKQTKNFSLMNFYIFLVKLR